VRIVVSLCALVWTGDGLGRCMGISLSVCCRARSTPAGRAAVLDGSSTKCGVQKYSIVLGKPNRSGGPISTKKLQDESGQALGIDTQ
jgi:hypothetical protein